MEYGQVNQVEVLKSLVAQNRLMEEPNKSLPNKTPQLPKPQNPTQNLPTPQPPPSSLLPPRHPLPQNNNKRKADNVVAAALHDNCYFKLRAIVKDLRPHFIEVLRTTDFRNSKAAHEIRKNMKLVMDICKQMTMETASIEMSKKPPEGQSLSSENMDGQEHVDRHHEEKQVKRHHPDRSADRSPDLPFSGNNSDKLEDDQPQGSYVIGGSNFGWNFVLFPGSKAVYYGVTKESFRMKIKKTGTE